MNIVFKFTGQNDQLSQRVTSSPNIHIEPKAQSPARTTDNRQKNPPSGSTADEGESLDSGSFEQDSLDGSGELDVTGMCAQYESSVKRLIARLSYGSGRQLLEQHDATEQPSSSPSTVQQQLSGEGSRERLIHESRQFVTASKMFVKSVTDSSQTMVTCLAQCVVLIERMTHAVEDVALHEHSRDLPPKVRDVARAFLHTLQSAIDASGQGVNDPSMGRLMGKATALAGVLTVLMRSLRP